MVARARDHWCQLVRHMRTIYGEVGAYLLCADGLPSNTIKDSLTPGFYLLILGPLDFEVLCDRLDLLIEMTSQFEFGVLRWVWDIMMDKNAKKLWRSEV